MKKVIIGVVMLSSLVFGYESISDSGYKSDSGKKYQYDLSNASDKRSYDRDIGAQQRDKYDKQYNNYDRHIQKDRSKGQYGGGIYDD